MSNQWFNIRIRRGHRIVFRGKAKSWRGLIGLLAEKHYGSFEEMVAHVFREDWVYLMTGKKVGDLDKEDRVELGDKLEEASQKIKNAEEIEGDELK